ncbi:MULTISPECIES: NADH-quinone oxidoreductase subunit L [Nitrosomonas]|uniref:Probable nuoL transmembrane NADH dehydrogenase I (Chain L) oxidoreductase protein n=1 Tax=Nitrosomonas europaea (strain ATCC 19718 / CIP 103999 / KCTC 2705 / NBRC 14298) TaxID=228410 RepID=Q82TV4_NITEU|nr:MULTISPECIES: NADH-quinone oxidoreductase subunit L [Nitrosomonas]CAD85677.1 probable nuoL; transmembrane NADH dehydrogenase I (chain L) oxidoreductase protein [Nitrosomonas europaea ATCC 19718]SDW76950.1 NADH dehydrogenase subunit L [Nitrosomonas europaea]SET30932.1 NADH dehydrogenase subunit L [Nitrosomonas europaea]SJZ86650.1 NADH dehydrogenase subunit L [Nitrosomonas europaea]HBF24740.1 NADH-quinone oxidoreductase subunit L [Nitrosomonas sp.]
MENLYLLVPMAPLVGAIIAGLFGRRVGLIWSHRATIILVALSLVSSIIIFVDVLQGNTYNGSVYTWLTSGETIFEIGFLIDTLSATMMVVVTSVSLMVHIYTIGYMHGDPGYQRFFSYISLFTFSMLMLVMSNNFLQLFFGWEAVGLVSYLLIGFWYTRPTAIYANLKAFLVNRVGDFGFLLGIGLVLMYFGTLDYELVFAHAEHMASRSVEIWPGQSWMLMTVICLLLFVGAMGKSAQFPLHVWLPDSMEGPTPISALIHAATMVTAGIFMVARMSPLFEHSEAALSTVLVIGGITTLFMALVAVVQNDIKRVVAFSTLSQLGYMTVALGASAYSAAIFHLMTHAFFKALLFLGAGSVIIAMHHEQDMRKMGGLRRYMPITFATMFIAALASAGVPGFSGFFSKDAIIEAVHFSQLPGSGFAYFCVLTTVFVTALYTFRLMFMTFYGEPRMDKHTREHLHESPWVVTVPLVVLAVPTVASGWLIGTLLFGDYFARVIEIQEQHDVVALMKEHYTGIVGMMIHSLMTLPFWLAMAGIFTAWFLYQYKVELPGKIRKIAGPVYTLLDRKYYIDEFYSWLFAGGLRSLSNVLWKYGDIKVIDGLMVNGSAKAVAWFSTVVRRFQSGYIYHYAFSMIVGVFVLMSLWLFHF